MREPVGPVGVGDRQQGVRSRAAGRSGLQLGGELADAARGDPPAQVREPVDMGIQRRRPHAEAWRRSRGRAGAKLGVRAPSLYAHVDGLPDLRRRIAARGARELAAELQRAAAARGTGALCDRRRVPRLRARHPGTYAALQRASELNEAASEEAAAGSLTWWWRCGRLRAGGRRSDPPRPDRAAALHGFVTLEGAAASACRCRSTTRSRGWSRARPGPRACVTLVRDVVRLHEGRARRRRGRGRDRGAAGDPRRRRGRWRSRCAPPATTRSSRSASSTARG